MIAVGVLSVITSIVASLALMNAGEPGTAFLAGVFGAASMLKLLTIAGMTSR